MGPGRGRDQENAVRLRVQRHCPRAGLSRDCLHDGEYGSGVSSCSTVSVPSWPLELKAQPVAGVKRGGIRAIADGRRRDNCAGIGIDHRHLAAVADGEQAAAFGIHREARTATLGRRHGQSP